MAAPASACVSLANAGASRTSWLMSGGSKPSPDSSARVSGTGRRESGPVMRSMPVFWNQRMVQAIVGGLRRSMIVSTHGKHPEV